MADPRPHLANLRFAKAALNSAADLLKIEEGAENSQLSAVCLSISQKARALSAMLEQEEDLATNLD
tara:strand:+ start:1904 stop:2101 length:198 start_codon:yes stop_codon:yes gene_type:complete